MPNKISIRFKTAISELVLYFPYSYISSVRNVSQPQFETNSQRSHSVYRRNLGSVNLLNLWGRRVSTNSYPLRIDLNFKVKYFSEGCVLHSLKRGRDNTAKLLVF